jgi:hypothetical protein
VSLGAFLHYHIRQRAAKPVSGTEQPEDVEKRASALADGLGEHRASLYYHSFSFIRILVAVAVFAPVLMRDDPPVAPNGVISMMAVATPLEKRRFLRWFITD